MSESEKEPVIVSGMHRSGTSLMASILEAGGVQMGEKLVPASPQNRRGFYEDVDFLELHRKMLRAARLNDSGWTVQSPIPVNAELAAVARRLAEQKAAGGDGKLWGWKDPRTLLFMDFWREVFPQARYVFVYRAPWEVVDSLFRRIDSGTLDRPRDALDYWMHYNRQIVRMIERAPQQCVLASVDRISGEPAQLIRKVNEAFGLALNTQVEERCDAELLHREENPWRAVLMERLVPEARELYDRLNSLAALPGDPWPREAQSTQEQLSDAYFKEWKELREALRKARGVPPPSSRSRKGRTLRNFWGFLGKQGR